MKTKEQKHFTSEKLIADNLRKESWSKMDEREKFRVKQRTFALQNADNERLKNTVVTTSISAQNKIAEGIFGICEQLQLSMALQNLKTVKDLDDYDLEIEGTNVVNHIYKSILGKRDPPPLAGTPPPTKKPKYSSTSIYDLPRDVEDLERTDIDRKKRIKNFHFTHFF